MRPVLTSTHLELPGQLACYRGKVRDVYHLGERIVMVATDRISAFDVILPRAIPDKGRILNTIAAKNLKATADIVPNWLIDVPDPNVSVGLACEPIKLEMVVRGYLAGHAWRQYALGHRMLCGAHLPDGLKENDQFPFPNITPSTKADEGHDEDISPAELIKRGVVSQDEWDLLSHYALSLFKRGSELAAQRGLILVDTKYEFGRHEGKLYLIDEVHTPDSSRYFYADGYIERQKTGEKQKQLSKEFVREWLMDNGFSGKEGQSMPEMTDEVVDNISARYRELFQQLTGENLPQIDFTEPINDRIKRNLMPLLD